MCQPNHQSIISGVVPGHDVQIATADVLEINDPCDFPGDSVTFTAQFDVVVTPSFRGGNHLLATNLTGAFYCVRAQANAMVEAGNGGSIVKEPFSFPGGRRFHFADPAGNVLAVWSDKG